MDGPFYLDLDRVRRDITEGKRGLPLELDVRIVDAAGCVPLRDVAVDIWHCDALGSYSGFEPANDLTFLRGTQITDTDGRCTFTTIVPGWYPGRAPHIHVKAHTGASTQVTTQMYFPDATLAAVYRQAPCSTHAGTHLSLGEDPISANSEPPPPLQVVREGKGYVTSFVLGINGS